MEGATANGPAGPWLISNVRQNMASGTLSIIISTLAFLVAFGNFYFSHLRKKRDLRAIVVDAGYLPTSTELYLDIVYVNGGTLQEVVTGVALDFFYEPREPLHGFLAISDVMPFMVRPDPIALPPKSKTLKRYRFLLVGEKLGSAIEGLPKRSGAMISSRLKFKVIDAEGFTYERTFSRGLMSRPDCPVAFGFVTDDLLPLERRSFDLSKLALDQKRFAEYRKFRMHPLAILRWAYWTLRSPTVDYASKPTDKIV